MGSWVTGDVVDPSEIPAQGEATYSGYAVGEVFDGSSLYTSTGTVDSTWNFGTRRGTVDLAFDNENYTGVTELQEGSSEFVGRLDGDEVAREGGWFGSFYSTGDNAVGGELGRFTIQEAEGAEVYRASGTFVTEEVPTAEPGDG